MANKQRKMIANNKKARHDYFIEETYEAGIVLTGTEIKSARLGKVSIKESYARIEKEEMMIYGMNISPYEQGNRFNVDPLRPRKTSSSQEGDSQANWCNQAKRSHSSSFDHVYKRGRPSEARDSSCSRQEELR